MNVDFADEEMIAYRESLIEKKKEQMKRKDCNFMTTDGYQVYVIIDKFVEFLNSRNEI